MNRIAVAIVALALAAPAFAQEYGDDDYSWQQVPQQLPQPPAQGPTFEDFQNDGELSYNGQWVDTPEYGMVWQPTSVESDWRPYLYGHWAWTEAGWAWVSDEPFGWAVYHYGRWAFDPDLGWFWIPGRVWAPAWVAWRWYGGYAGWCPLGPRGLLAAQQRWVWVDQRNFLEPVQHHVVPRPIVQGTAMPAPQTGPRAGPPVAVIARATGRPVSPLSVRDGQSPHSPQAVGGTVYFYRPQTAPVTPHAQAPVARPRMQPYSGGVPGPAYGGMPRPQAQQSSTPRVSPNPRPAPTAQPLASQPRASPPHASAPVKSEPHVKEK